MLSRLNQRSRPSRFSRVGRSRLGNTVSTSYTVAQATTTAPPLNMFLLAVRNGVALASGAASTNNYVYDVSDLEAISGATVATGGSFAARQVDLTADGQYGIVVKSANNRMYVLDLTTPASPALVGVYDLSNAYGGCVIDSTYALVSSFSGNVLHSVNWSTKTAPVVADTLALASITALWYDGGDHVFATGTAGVVYAINISTPTDLTNDGNITIGGAQPEVVYNNNGLIAVAQAAGTPQIHLVDVSDPAAMSSVGEIVSADLESGTDAIQASNGLRWLDSNVLAVASEERITLFDCSSPSSPSIMSDVERHTGSVNAGALAFDNGYLYHLSAGHFDVYEVSVG